MTMLNRIFDPDNFIFRPMGILVDVLAFSLMWLFGSVTLILYGPSTTALYDSMARCLSKRSLGGYGRYVESIKSNFKVACPAGLLTLAIYWALLQGYNWFCTEAAQGGARYALYIAYCVFLIVIGGITAYLFPVLSRFEFRLGGLLAASLKLALSHPLTTLLLGLLTSLCVAAGLNFWPAVFVLPYLWARLACLLLERVFQPFMEPPAEQESPTEE